MCLLGSFRGADGWILLSMDRARLAKLNIIQMQELYQSFHSILGGEANKQL